MPAFDTPEPITATLSIEAGTLRVIAGDGAATVVDVLPTSEAREADVRAAERTRVEFANGKLLVKGHKELSPFSRGSSVDVEITLPAGSEVRAATTMAHFSARGRLGDCEVKTSAGDIQVEQAGTLRLTTGYGEVSVGRANGAAHVTTASGEVRLAAVKGAATVKSSNGAVELGEIEGELSVKAGNGSVAVERAAADVTVRTVNGAVRVGELASGTAVLETAAGQVEFGVREGTAAWLDVRTRAGAVRNSLEETAPPGEPAEARTLKVRARTGMGDITIRRA
ncbi:DUF4097 family beta strand repeat protein [Streptomyces sp. G44]|uniref:DUF4097 family beta strand repeat-containing protein n=1 Tax=Streptomyces sp. G44 TaxID=2807632 RepID=UPI001960DB98|nr:DUF4097 family beta strand repeat-containing protein [Streptomyces sp. G44]MBM7170482.1 DUF4097 family beta strand repeat protein [Streptomyces sp. G44]